MIPQLNPTLSFLPNVSLTFEGQVICKKSPMAVFMYPIEQIRLRIQFWFICIGQIMIWSHLGSVSKKIEDFWEKNENPNYQFCLGKTKFLGYKLSFSLLKPSFFYQNQSKTKILAKTFGQYNGFGNHPAKTTVLSKFFC